MGQQQLLLVILVTIIVGIATVVAINTFGSAADSANVDAVRNDVAQIAAAAQAYYMKPDMLGGGGRTFTGITFDDIAFASNGISSDGLTAQNENGFYVMTVSAQSIDVVAHPASSDDYIPGTVDTDGVLTVGTEAAAADQLSGTIIPDDFNWDS
jgi:hypothetical protein